MLFHSKTFLLFLLYGLGYGLLIVFVGCDSTGREEYQPNNKGKFVGAETCKSCHQQAYDDWKKSDHFLAMQAASDSTVLGDFNQTTFNADGVNNTFFKRDGKYFINTQGEDGKYHDYEILYTFGYFPLQQYLIAFPGGRLQTTRASWDDREKKWFHQYPGQQIHHQDWFHWTGNSQNWNTMCASCHSTNLQKNYDFATDTYKTTWDEINVSCESCHGPGSAHLEFVQSQAYQKGVYLKNAGFAYARDTTPQLQLNTCASCHARQTDLGMDIVGTDEILDNLIPQVISNEFYYADGQIKEEVYEYGSFTQSKMFHNNVRCTNCHNPHSGKLKMSGNQLCLSCHKPEYDTEAHHFHAPDSEASQCINCHMTVTTYMGNDHRRDHSFRVPRPDQSVRYNTPNACTGCHTTKSTQWAADAVNTWYGPKRMYHFSDDLLLGSLLDEKSEFHLIKLLADTTQPEISRATAANYLGNIPTSKSIETLLTAITDTKALVRYQSLRALENFPPELWQQKAWAGLNDKVRAVRIAAADLYHRLPPESIPASALDAYTAANRENLTFLEYQTDFAVGNVMLADYKLQGGDYSTAVIYYRRGLAKDSLMNYARLNLASTLSILGKNEEALKALELAAMIDPLNERIFYNLGLLNYEMNRIPAALSAFQRAVVMGSIDISLYYNYGLALQSQQQVGKAEQILLKGYSIDASAVNINYALAAFYLAQNKPEKALKHAAILQSSDPRNPDFTELFRILGL